MLNTIHVNYMTRTFGRLITNDNHAGRDGKNKANAEDARSADSTTHIDRMASAILEAARRSGKQVPAPQTGSAGQSSADVRNRELQPLERSAIEAMTMDEYKEYIRERILSLPMHSSHMQDTISIIISDEGFEAMKKDAEYEEWVLKDLRTAWTWDNPWARYMGGAYSVIHYGASKEECHAKMWNAGFRHGNGKGMLENMSGDDDQDDKKRKSEIVVKPDGTRYLVISEVIAGMKVTVMSLKLTEPDELLQDGADTQPEIPAQQMLIKGGISTLP